MSFAVTSRSRDGNLCFPRSRGVEVRLRQGYGATASAHGEGLPSRSAVRREGWWSQTGSNRRPHACKARALPTELWPLFEEEPLKLRACHRPVRPRYHTRSVVGPGRLELPTSRLSGVCSNQLSYRPLKRHVLNAPSLMTGFGTRDRTTASI